MFEQLLGEHYLSGVDFENFIYKWEAKELNASKGRYHHIDEDGQTIRILLDDNIFMAIEDSDDGYRSYCSDLILYKKTNHFLINFHRIRCL
jgi:hypothetical protein